MYSPKLRQRPGRRAAPGFSLRDRACGRARRVSRFLQKNRKIQEKTAMRFQQGQSGNPAGRPRGALNRATVLAQELLSARVESIAGKLIELAEGGDMRAIRVCMERLMPVIKHQPIAVELPPIENAADSVEAVASIAAAVAAGELTATEAAELAKVVDSYVGALASREFEERLSKLEQGISDAPAVPARDDATV
jgi:phage tail tape-measure protein